MVLVTRLVVPPNACALAAPLPEDRERREHTIAHEIGPILLDAKRRRLHALVGPPCISVSIEHNTGSDQPRAFNNLKLRANLEHIIRDYGLVETTNRCTHVIIWKNIIWSIDKCYTEHLSTWRYNKMRHKSNERRWMFSSTLMMRKKLNDYFEIGSHTVQ